MSQHRSRAPMNTGAKYATAPSDEDSVNVSAARGWIGEGRTWRRTLTLWCVPDAARFVGMWMRAPAARTAGTRGTDGPHLESS